MKIELPKKRDKRKNGKEKMIYNPVRITEVLQGIGAKYDKKETVLYYSIVFTAGIVLGGMMSLQLPYMIAVAVVYIFFVPQLIYNQKRSAYELRRFRDVNAYMSQMAQSFTGSGNILSSLQETHDTFARGKMKSLLAEVIENIRNGEFDVRRTQAEEFAKIEKAYECEKLRTLHAFLMTAQARGGQCSVEFSIFEKVRLIWAQEVTKYHNKIMREKIIGIILYVVLMLLCVFIAHSFPEELSIIHLALTQFVNAAMLALFIVFYIFLDRRLNRSLLTEAKPMSEKEVLNLYEFIENYDKKEEQKRYLVIQIAAVLIAVLFFVKNPTPIAFAIGIVLIAATFNINRISLILTRRRLKSEMIKAFPKWLFDMLLLIQRESVDGAIFKSVERAAPVLAVELRRISAILEEKPKNNDAYMSFLADYNIDGVEDCMRKLYSLAVGTQHDTEVMRIVIDSHMTLFEESERRNIEQKGDMSAMYNFIPVGIVTLGMIGYMASLLYLVFEKIIGMLG